METLDGVCMRKTLCKAGIEQRFSAFFKKLFLNNEIKAFTLKTHFSASSSARNKLSIEETLKFAILSLYCARTMMDCA